jgi:hypothetical protein
MRASRGLALLLAILLSGGHMAALQVVAWAGMLTSRTQTMSWSAAISSTFSGAAPCRVCRAVSVLAVEAPQASVTPTVKPDLAPPTVVTWILPAPQVAQVPPVALSALVTLWTGDVPTPPPQGC